MGGILCMPVDGENVSKIWIRVDSNGQLEQIVKQLQKLEDVQVVQYHDAEHQVFVQLEEYFKVS
jgi:acetolactate synthase-1/3 small subunit